MFGQLPGFHNKNLQSISTLRSILKKFEVTGTLLDLHLNVEEGENVVSKKNSVFPLRSASKKLEISTRKVRNILRSSLLKKAFKAKVLQKLTERKRKARIDARYC